MFRTCLNEIVQDATTGRNLSDIHFWQIGTISTITKVSCILFVHYVTIMCCQDAAGQQGQWHHQHRLRGPAGQVSCDWSASQYWSLIGWPGPRCSWPSTTRTWRCWSCSSRTRWLTWSIADKVILCGSTEFCSILKLMDTAFNLISIEASTTLQLHSQSTHETRYTGKLDHFLYK